MFCNIVTDCVIFVQRNRQMKEKDFSGPDLPLFSSEASVQLAFLTLIEAQKSSRELHLILFLSSIQPQTPLFIQPTKFYPSRQRTLARNRGPKIKNGGILQVRKWLFDNYLLHDRLEDNQSIKQIQRLGVYPTLLQNTQRHYRSWESHHITSSYNACFAKNLYVSKRNKSAVRRLHTSVISEKRLKRYMIPWNVQRSLSICN